jgi:hypothetical protein
MHMDNGVALDFGDIANVRSQYYVFLRSDAVLGAAVRRRALSKCTTLATPGVSNLSELTSRVVIICVS